MKYRNKSKIVSSVMKYLVEFCDITVSFLYNFPGFIVSTSITLNVIPSIVVVM